jgi:tellurite resistance protein
MATKTDFTEAEWTALQRGVTGSAMLVSLADRDFTDTFGEVGAMTKFLQGQQVAAPSELIREVAKTHSTGFGITTSPQNLRAETMAALQAAIAALNAKSPDDLAAYRQTVLGVAQAVAEAKGGVTAVETAMLEEIRQAVDGG